jgi:hypothetical protein
MQHTALALVSAVALARATMAQDLPPEVLLLSRVRTHVTGELQRLPNISCLETVRREYQPPKGALRLLDTVRLEVLANGQKELFAFPGERNFSEQHPATYASRGLFGDGLFGHYLKNVFSGNGSNQYKGEEGIAGHRLARFDYRLPVLWSGQTITLPEGSGKVGFHGSYWVDPLTYDVTRLELNADDIPPTLPIAELAISINYARTRLGGNVAALLPESADIRLVKYSGEIKLNRVEFTNCHVFGAESTISFDASSSPLGNPRPEVAAARNSPQPLPGGLEIAVKLRTPISSETAVGASIDGVVADKVRPRQGEVAIAAGSPVHGRIRRLERNTSPSPHFIVSLEFTEVELGGVPYRFYADLQRAGATVAVGQTSLAPSRTDYSGLQSAGQDPSPRYIVLWSGLPGIGEFIVKGSKLNLPQGFRTVWQTRPPLP